MIPTMAGWRVWRALESVICSSRAMTTGELFKIDFIVSVCKTLFNQQLLLYVFLKNTFTCFFVVVRVLLTFFIF